MATQKQKQQSSKPDDPVMRIQAALNELSPALNEFKSESVQLRLVSNYVIPMLLYGEVRMQIESSLEYFISHAGKLSAGDNKQNLKALELMLEALKAQKSFLGILIEKKCRDKYRKSDKRQSQIERLHRKIEKQMDELKEGDAGQDRRKAMLDNLQKFLDIVRSMNPQI